MPLPNHKHACAAIVIGVLATFAPAGGAESLPEMNRQCGEIIAKEQFRKAEPLCSASLAEARNVGAVDRELAVALRNQADVHAELDRPREAEALYLDSLKVYSQIRQDDSLEAAEVMEDLGDLYFDERKFALAEPHLRRALEIRTRIQGINAKDTVELRTEYEKLLRRLGHKRE